MAISEQAPKTPRQERAQPPDAAFIASRMAGAVDNVRRDGQTINKIHELRRRADMAMVAMLEVVSPVLPETVREQVNRLIGIHDELYQTATPSAEQPAHEHEQGTSPRTRSRIR
jgi:hypothetical protein